MLSENRGEAGQDKIAIRYINVFSRYAAFGIQPPGHD